jgi:hypothetical protein
MADKMTKAQMQQIIADADKAAVTIGDTLSIYVGTDAVNSKMPADIQKGLNRGDVVKFADGSKQFIDTDVVVDLSKSGSAMYTWNKDDTRVKHDRVLVTIDADGNRSTKKIGSVYKKF